MASLLAITGRCTGIRYPLEGRVMLIGRSSSCGIQLIDESVSRHHVAIKSSGEGFDVEDLGSQNGSQLNGAPLSGRAALRPGDTVTVGATTFVFEPSLEYLGAPGADVVIAQEHQATSAARVVTGEEHDQAVALSLLDLIGRNFRARADGRGLLRSALSQLAERFEADRAFVLRTSSDAKPKVLASFGEGPIVISRTVVAQVLERREAVLCADAPQELSFRGSVSLAAGEIRALCAAPLIVDGQTLGMVHIDRKQRGGFAPDQLGAFVRAANVFALVLVAGEGIERLRKQGARAHRFVPPQVVFKSAALGAVLSEAERAAPTDATVLITGETGTGKEVIARTIHANSARASGPFVAVNCGALPESLQESELFGHLRGAFTGASADKEGLFLAAEGGTLFLDEVGETSRATQVKLLRALQERAVFRIGSARSTPVDVRVLAATSRSLEDMAAVGDFREDLLFRLKVVHLRVPPLRARTEDIEPLVEAFVGTIAGELGVPIPVVDHEVMEALKKHSWPGNVRELRNAIERLIIMANEGRIELGDLPPELVAGRAVAQRKVRSGGTLAEAVGEVEKEMILRAMARTGAVKSAVADALGISRVTLDAKLKVHGIAWPKK